MRHTAYCVTRSATYNHFYRNLKSKELEIQECSLALYLDLYMSNRVKYGVLFLVLAQIAVIAFLFVAPRLVNALPGEYRVRLARVPVVESLLKIGVTPLPTALPAPVGVADRPIISIPAVPASTATPTSVPIDSPIIATTESEFAEQTPQPTLTPPPTATPSPTSTPKPLPRQARVDDLKIIAQGFNNCGPANLTQVLNWYGSDITQEDVASYLKPNPEDRNVSPWQISDYVNERMPGFKAITRSGGDLEMIKRFVAAGFPVVIEKGYELPESGWWGHYLTIYGYDDELQELYSQDTYLGPFDGSGRIDSYRDFLPFWQQFNNTFYVVYRPEQEETVKSLMGEEMFDDIKMWQKVAAIAEQETTERPDDVFSWFNLGTALTRIGGLTGEAKYYQGGTQAFDRAREIGLPPRMLWYQFEPYLAYLRTDRFQDIIDLADATLATQGGRNVEETFWYKGHALAYLGDVSAAITAYRTALSVNENFYPAQISLDSLGG